MFLLCYPSIMIIQSSEYSTWTLELHGMGMRMVALVHGLIELDGTKFISSKVNVPLKYMFIPANNPGF